MKACESCINDWIFLYLWRAMHWSYLYCRLRSFFNINELESSNNDWTTQANINYDHQKFIYWYVLNSYWFQLTHRHNLALYCNCIDCWFYHIYAVIIKTNCRIICIHVQKVWLASDYTLLSTMVHLYQFDVVWFSNPQAAKL